MKKLTLNLVAGAFALALSASPVSASTRRLGMDVSSYQDSSYAYFNSMKAKGAQFVLVKLGGSGGGEGYHYQNPKASAQLSNAKKSGLGVGGYYWGQFGANESKAAQMANMAVSDAKKFGLESGSAIALDYEAGATYSKSANTAAIKVFMAAVKKEGYKPILYSGAYYLRQYVDYESIGKQYGDVLWVASYKTTSLQTKPDFGYFPSMNHVGMWQYADNWYGIDGNVELINGLVSTGKVAKRTPVTSANATTNKAQGVRPIPKSNKYTIKQGDSWYAIAKRYGLDAGLLAQLNGKTTKSMIHPGNVIKLTGTITIKVEPKKVVKKPKTTTHVVKVNSLGAGKETWKVNLIGSNGKYANHYVAQGSSWKTTKSKTFKKGKAYLIGKDLWILSKYVKVVK
ncbi:LysM peptidoglycan-binding domain-containing protein [Lactobacillus delbrueckii subsp. lactis]|uniref:GH25 family lysozyme n=1 Tax=Lactobacillus delbrueckii TaxID=1584 RepID=UPI001E626313|nr:GH25 family lysozyme [Lactobacillus delbrueckii]MCD5605799.1 LysM peptidoglycan-binding domain-containing protein [Lactobacillus delbrueckii subsp. lactis]